MKDLREEVGTKACVVKVRSLDSAVERDPRSRRSGSVFFFSGCTPG